MEPCKFPFLGCLLGRASNAEGETSGFHSYYFATPSDIYIPPTTAASLMTKVQLTLRSLDLKEARYSLSLKEMSHRVTQSHMRLCWKRIPQPQTGYPQCSGLMTQGRCQSPPSPGHIQCGPSRQGTAGVWSPHSWVQRSHLLSLLLR